MTQQEAKNFDFYFQEWVKRGDREVHVIKAINLSDALVEMEPFIRGTIFFHHMFKVDDSILKELVDYYFECGITFAIRCSNRYGRILVVHYDRQIPTECILI